MGLFNYLRTKLLRFPTTVENEQPQDGEDGKAFATSGSIAWGGKGGKGVQGRGGKGGDAVAIGSGSVAIGGKGGDVVK